MVPEPYIPLFCSAPHAGLVVAGHNSMVSKAGSSNAVMERDQAFICQRSMRTKSAVRFDPWARAVALTNSRDLEASTVALTVEQRSSQSSRTSIQTIYQAYPGMTLATGTVGQHHLACHKLQRSLERRLVLPHQKL